MKTERFCGLQQPGSARAAGRRRALAQTALALVLCAAVASCSALKDFSGYDTPRDISKDQYKELLNREPPAPQQRSAEPPIPGFQSVLAAPSAPELADTRRVSIAVTETVPVRDILIELARKAQVDLELDPRISGGVIMTVTDRPFVDVVARIAELAELRYKFERNTLKVEIDDPYLEQYRMDMLNIRRSATSAAGSSTDAASSASSVGSGGGGGGGNKSSSSIESSTSSDFWKDIGDNIGQLLAEIQTRRGNVAATVDATYVPEQQKAAAPAAPAAGAPAAGMVEDAVTGLHTLEDHDRALSFLAGQIDQVAQMRADIEGRRQERFVHRYIRRHGLELSPLVPGAVDKTSLLDMDVVLRALIIDDLAPNPQRDAGSQAILSHMQALQNLGYEVSFVAAEEFAAEGDAVNILEGMGVHYLGPPYYGSVEEVMRRQSDCLDLVYFHRISNASKYMAVTRRYCPKARLLYSVADLHHSRIAAQANIEERPELMALSRRTRLLECTASWLADAVLTHSPEEARWLRAAVPDANIYVAPWEVTVRPVETPFAQRHGLAFVGGYAHSPNIDAARFLVEDVMPLVWERDPTIECVLAGSGMPESIMQFAGPNVKVVGHVPDLATLFAELRLTVAPLRYGAGINGKVLASFAAGLPCVMSQVAAEGLDLTLPLDQLVAKTAGELAAQILKFHESEALSDEVGKAALSFIRERHNKAEVERALKTAIDGTRQ